MVISALEDRSASEDKFYSGQPKNIRRQTLRGITTEVHKKMVTIEHIMCSTYCMITGELKNIPI